MPIRLLYVIPEAWPTFRPDITVLFGNQLPVHGVETDLVTHRGAGGEQWSGGRAILCSVGPSAASRHIKKIIFNTVTLFRQSDVDYDAVQVRNMPIHAAIALLAARVRKVKFFYWMSFPQSEGQIARARAIGCVGGAKYFFLMAQGRFGKWLLYQVVLRHADHVFVQSDRMLEDVASRGIRRNRLTAVPMAVDLVGTDHLRTSGEEESEFVGRRVAVYLGTLDRERRLEVLLEMMAILRAEYPELLLLFVGDTEQKAHKEWLRSMVVRLGLTDAVRFTGWLPTPDAWRQVRAAAVGLSPIPRGPLFDSSSPTKMLEYMALGIPVLVSDSPEQARIIRESGAGLCVENTAIAFAEGMRDLLCQSARSADMGRRGREYVEKVRDYRVVAKGLADIYRRLLERPRDDQVGRRGT